MKRKRMTFFAVVAGSLLAAAPAAAHHSVSGEFDNSKPIEFAGGVVKAVEWTNPHIYTQVEVKGPDGKVTVYRVEGGAPNAIFRNGWRKESVKPGTIVSFKGIRAKNPASMNIYGPLTLPDGKVAWQGQPPAY
jgi:hypothetical protein